MLSQRVSGGALGVFLYLCRLLVSVRVEFLYSLPEFGHVLFFWFPFSSLWLVRLIKKKVLPLRCNQYAVDIEHIHFI